jgi:hypothetical protein
MVTCGNCGQELIGNVNRCWRCGCQFVATPDSGTIPPKRPELVQQPQDLPVAYLAADAERISASVGHERPNDPESVQFPKVSSRDSLVFTALAVAAVSFFGSFFSGWAAVPAAIAGALSFVGVRSSRKKMAFLAMFLSGLAFLFSGIQTMNSLRTYYELHSLEEDDGNDF